MSRRLQAFVVTLAVVSFAPIVGQAQSAAKPVAKRQPAQPPSAAPICSSPTHGKINFRGKLPAAGGISLVRIFPWSEDVQFYVDNLASQTSGRMSSGLRVASEDELAAALQHTSRLPAIVASASVAVITDGAFECDGFVPGRYLFLAQLQGAGNGAPGVLLTYLTADVNVSSFHRTATILVRGFRRIGSLPPS